jgi:DNA-binding response OmpR family regulator
MTIARNVRPTVLIVEDEALVAMLVEDTLAEAGYRPVWMRGACGSGADNSGSAAEAVSAAVVDLRLARGLDGRDVLRRLRERRPAMPALVVTGYDPLMPEADLRGLGGPTLRLRKPFDCDELLERLADVLRGPAAATPRRRASDVQVTVAVRGAADVAA